MIHPQELRLGNLLNATKVSDTIQVKVKGIEKKTIRTAIFNISVENLHGIPLTEEWLIKLGFHEIFGVYAVYGREINLKLSDGYWEAYFKGKYVSVINHVHQLQNLFYALTGQELVTKPANE
ncbi:hypothetical protein QT327_10670 [Olivibacter sp. 47]|uniref:hypothetical protein n=1 Tax=Olivibacter sp. 47 TaxID=3056486 RepID=UPI0025A391BA|nr:hypothetical protein [Olivibacter sp. 47]MDM8174813.1 hypothetical protein [Olivibacter sp. 47]